MPREVPSGTPTRTKQYVIPGSSGRLRWASLAAGAALLLGLTTAYLLGFGRFVSPGDLATAHAPIDFRCAQCHTPRPSTPVILSLSKDDRRSGQRAGVMDLRCERCHDPVGSERLTNAAHVLLGSGDPAKAERAEIVPCVQCHTDHRGRQFTLRAVDDRECARCHEFSALATHPEFAVVKAQATTGLGLAFKHDHHIVDAQKATGMPCETCHVPTRDLSGFEPISFDTHCARCHAHVVDGFLTGRSNPLAAELLLRPDQWPGPWTGTPSPRLVDADAPGDVQVDNLIHRDPWVLFNARALRRAIDPDGEEVERLALRSQIAWLAQQVQLEPLPSVPGATLQAWAAALESELAAIDARLARGGADDARALAEARQVIDELAATIARIDPKAAADAGALTATGQAGAGAAAENGESVDVRQRRLDARRKELLGLLDAIAARNPQLADRAAALGDRVKQIGLYTGGAAADPAALVAGLEALNEVFRAVRGLQDPGGLLDAAQIAELRRLARQRVTAGLVPDDFETRRRELLSALDAVATRADETMLLRVAALRQRVLSVRPGSLGDADLRRLRQQKERLLRRVRLELELAAAGDEPRTAVSAPLRDRPALQATLERLRNALADLERGPWTGDAVSEADRVDRIDALESLLTACTKCHELSGARLARVTAAQPVMPRSIFTHAPHVQQTSCTTCHASVYKSRLATDVNVPGVATCRTCHAPSEARSDCATCHIYHPRSAATLGSPL